MELQDVQKSTYLAICSSLKLKCWNWLPATLLWQKHGAFVNNLKEASMSIVTSQRANLQKSVWVHALWKWESSKKKRWTFSHIRVQWQDKDTDHWRKTCEVRFAWQVTLRRRFQENLYILLRRLALSIHQSVGFSKRWQETTGSSLWAITDTSNMFHVTCARTQLNHKHCIFHQPGGRG